MFSWNTFSYDTQKLKNKSLLSLEKKETFACAIFGKSYVAYAINRAGKLICLRACLHKRDRAGLIDKPANIYICHCMHQC